MQRPTKISMINSSSKVNQTKNSNSLSHKIFHEIVYGGHMPALDTSAMVFTTTLILGFIPTIDLIVAAYLFTFGSYTLNRVRESDDDALSNPERTKFIIGRTKYVNHIIVLCYLGSLSIAIIRSPIFFSALMVPLLLSYLYNIGSKKFVPIMGTSRLKEQFLVKNIVVSAGWGLVVFLTVIYYNGNLNTTVFSVFIFIFLRVFVNTVFCDIRDVQSDSSIGIRTIPIVFGVKKTKYFLLAVNTLSGIFVFLAVIGGILPPMAHFVNLLTIFGYYYLIRSLRPNADMTYLCDFVAEGEELVSVPLAILGKVIF